MKYTISLEEQEEGGYTAHGTLKKGTLHAILKQADISIEEFSKYL